MPDLFLDDADLAAQVLKDRGYPQLAATVRGLIARCDTLAELVDEAHADLDRRAPGDGGPYQLTARAVLTVVR